MNAEQATVFIAVVVRRSIVHPMMSEKQHNSNQTLLKVIFLVWNMPSINNKKEDWTNRILALGLTH